MKRVTINSRSFDGEVRKSWEAELVESSGSLLLFVGEFDRDVDHADLGRVEKGTISYEYYWLDRWYNVFRFHHPDGFFRNFYCNVNMPPTFDGQVLDYIDLDLDVIVNPGGDYRIIDEDEFASNAVRFAFDEEIRRKVAEALEGLTSLIEQRKFPFDTL